MVVRIIVGALARSMGLAAAIMVAIVCLIEMCEKGNKFMVGWMRGAENYAVRWSVWFQRDLLARKAGSLAHFLPASALILPFPGAGQPFSRLYYIRACALSFTSHAMDRATGSSHLAFTLAALCGVGGLAGYVKTRSTPSLIAGLGIGGMYAYGGYLINVRNIRFCTLHTAF